jgi:hypothetical protein
LGLPKNGPTNMSSAFQETYWSRADSYYNAGQTEMPMEESIIVNIPQSVTNMAFCFYGSHY